MYEGDLGGGSRNTVTLDRAENRLADPTYQVDGKR